MGGVRLYRMSASTGLRFSLGIFTFSIFIAPADDIEGTVLSLVNRHPGPVLYLCGPCPVYLTRLKRNDGAFEVHHPVDAEALLALLASSTHPLVLIEHDPSVYDGAYDHIHEVGLCCRRHAERTGRVIMMAPRPDGVIGTLESYSHRMGVIMNKAGPVMYDGKRRPEMQQTLEAWGAVRCA